MHSKADAYDDGEASEKDVPQFDRNGAAGSP